MHSMTRWEQSPVFDPGNPNQRTQTAFAFAPAGNGGFQNVWFNPIAPGDSARFLPGSGAPGGGVSGVLAGVSVGTLAIAGAVTGVVLGAGWFFFGPGPDKGKLSGARRARKTRRSGLSGGRAEINVGNFVTTRDGRRFGRVTSKSSNKEGRMRSRDEGARVVRVSWADDTYQWVLAADLRRAPPEGG
jgi:hypothetical protein